MRVERGLWWRPLSALTLCAVLLSLAMPAQAADRAEPLAADPVLEAQVLDLAHKLRCLVCQNESIAESRAPLAIDLRNQVREQFAAGRSESEVIEFLVARYGDFVLYAPPFRASTVLLWLGPLLMLVGGAGWLALRLRRRQSELLAPQLSEAERAQAQALLAGPGSTTADSSAASPSPVPPPVPSPSPSSKESRP